MALSFNECVSILKESLSRDELDKGVAYAAETAIPGGVQLQFPRILMEVPSPAYLAFVDREPQANWGHRCRYVLISRDTGKITSQEARFPPFETGKDLHWRVVYRANGVDDSAVFTGR
jgi:hypothetical protein